MSRKVQVYKVFRRIAGTLFSAIVDGPCRIEYSKKDKYDLVFAFVDYEKALDFAGPLSWGSFHTVEVWLCSAEKAFVPRFLLSDACSNCNRWSKTALKRLFTGKDLKKHPLYYNNFCIFCAKADKPGVARIVPLAKSLSGTVVCEGLKLVKKVRKV